MNYMQRGPHKTVILKRLEPGLVHKNSLFKKTRSKNPVTQNEPNQFATRSIFLSGFNPGTFVLAVRRLTICDINLKYSLQPFKFI